MIGLFGSEAPAVQALRGDEIRLLVSLGLHAAFNGHWVQALRLFDALQVLRPERSFPVIGRATTLLAAGRASEAVSALEAALRVHPGDNEVLAVLGIALRNASPSAGSRALNPTGHAAPLTAPPEQELGQLSGASDASKTKEGTHDGHQ